MEGSTSRIYWLDNLKAVGIFMVILSHMHINHYVAQYLHSFGLPLFFFASGRLFDRNKYTFGQFFWKRFRTLLVPYFFFAVVSFLFWLFVVRLLSVEGRALAIDPLKGFLGIFYGVGSGAWKNPLNTALWFFPCLFAVEMLYYIIRGRWYLLACLAILGYLSCKLPFRLPLSLDVALIAIMFYGMGQFYKDAWLKYKYLPFIIITNVTFCFLNARTDMNNLLFGNMFYYYISAIAGILFYTSLFKLLKPNKLLDYLGRNTVVIIGMEGLIWYCMNAIHYAILGTRIHQTGIVFGMVLSGAHVVLSMPPIYLINTFFPFLLGKPKTDSRPLGLVTMSAS